MSNELENELETELNAIPETTENVSEENILVDEISTVQATMEAEETSQSNPHT